MLIVQSVIVGVIYLVLGFLEEYLSFPMCSRPMVVGSVIGFFLGDLKTGVMIGASLELVFMGAVQIGASTPPDSLVGTAVGTAFAIIMHADVEVALALAVPVALLVSMTSSIWLTLRTFWHPTIEKMMDKGDYKGLERMFYVVALTLYIPKALLVTFAIMAGSTVVEKMISIIPEFVTGGLGVAAGMMVAVGFAMLLKMMWTKKLAVYFFVGFILSSYLGLPLMAIAILGILYVIVLYVESSHKPTQSSAEEEEELFND